METRRLGEEVRPRRSPSLSGSSRPGLSGGDCLSRGQLLPAGGWREDPWILFPILGILTPGRPSLPGQKRLEKNPLDGELAVTLPISYETAQKLLTEMSGERAPEAWQGGLGTIYRTGDGVGAKVVMRVENKTVERAVYVVVGKIPGKSRPREVVALGSHFDAWVYGTTDPNAGTAVVMETAAFFADLAKSGWRPERTLAFVHWDGEEFGVIGSTEWEEELERRGERVVLTINEDAAVGGPDFGIVATPGHRSLLVRYVERFLKEYGRERFSLKIPQKFDVGAVVSCGSDHCAPLYRQNSGVFAFWSAGSYGVYHSLYDNPLYYQRFVDPGYLYGRDLSKILAGTSTSTWKRRGKPSTAPISGVSPWRARFSRLETLLRKGWVLAPEEAGIAQRKTRLAWSRSGPCARALPYASGSPSGGLGQEHSLQTEP